MTKGFRTIKVSIVMGILLVSLFAAFIPTSSARNIGNLSSYVNMMGAENESGLKPIVPRGNSAELKIDVIYGVTAGGILSKVPLIWLNGRQINIKLSIVEKPDWCTATLPTDTLTAKISTDVQPFTTTVTLRVDENAPAYGAGYVKIKAEVPQVGLFLAGFNQVFNIDFTAEYLPMISATMPEGNSKTIGPLDTASFPIEIENMGNARTTVTFKVDYAPKDWIAVVTDEITLDESQGSTGTAYLTIKPPKGFGYHNEAQSITVTMTPARAEDLRNVGESKTVTVIVESRGFSTPGFEPLLFIGALFAVVLLLKLKRKR
ncbi:MAG: hypothetical protein JXA00_06715 [Candidatus Thermoplasmatota archaeon]|nr:hypothetical protein [Candidatus Thermoplasmatota archaeon]